jgi:hypothetical protein
MNINLYNILYNINLVIILRWVFRKLDVEVWTGPSWLKVGTGGGHF